MKKIKTVILRTAGTNCDIETAFAFRQAGSEVDLIHINEIKKNKACLKKYHILAIPGGFTYGDDVASGKVLANELKFNLKEQLYTFVSSGKLIIGICNGFQVLVKMGILPNTGKRKNYNIESTLSLNDSGKFIDKWVSLKVGENGDNSRCIWTKDLPDTIYVPIAHAEGKFIPGDHDVLRKLKKNKQVVFRYCDNPNGSIDNIAGVCDPTGRILGMMPHPERHVTYLQHPNWRRPDPDEGSCLGIGIEVFKNGVDFARSNL